MDASAFDTHMHSKERWRNLIRWTALAVAVLLAWPWNDCAWSRAILPALSPHVGIAHLLTLHDGAGLALLALPLLIAGLFVPRIFCRYACPTGFLQKRFSGLLGRTPREYPRFPSVGRILLLMTWGGAVMGYPLFLWLDPLALFHGFMNGWRLPLALVAVAAGVGLPLLIVLDCIYPGLWCRKICPLGAVQELLARANSRPGMRAKPSANPGGFNRLARRGFLAVCAGAAAGAWAGRGASDQGPLRPPGAVDESRFGGLCLRCGNCAQTCPSRIIQPDVASIGTWMTPVLEFQSDYCRSDCCRCGRACPSGAITPMNLCRKNSASIGVAVLNLDLCWLAAGRECTACIKSCPWEALTLKSDGFTSEPALNPSKCNGCGACESVCPARPTRAVVVRRP